MPKKGGATFGYVEQFNYPLSPCYKNQEKAGWHSGGNGSCAKKAVEGYTGIGYTPGAIGFTPGENEISGGGFFDWIMGKGDKKKSTSTSGKKKKSSTSTTTDKKKKKSSSTSASKKKPSKI